MGYRFSVDLAALQRAADGVNEVLAEVGQVNLSHLPTGADVTGDGALADVLGDFCSRWQRGVGNLATEGQQIAGRLTYAARAYATYEEATRKAASEGTGAAGGGTAAGTVAGQASDPGVPG
jgi:hypothetical protein